MASNDSHVFSRELAKMNAISVKGLESEDGFVSVHFPQKITKNIFFATNLM